MHIYGYVWGMHVYVDVYMHACMWGICICMGMHGEVYMCVHVEGKCSPQLLFLRQPGLIIGLELIDYARLADQAAPGTHLSLSPKFWAGKFKWPHLVFFMWFEEWTQVFVFVLHGLWLLSHPKHWVTSHVPRATKVKSEGLEVLCQNTEEYTRTCAVSQGCSCSNLYWHTWGASSW